MLNNPTNLTDPTGFAALSGEACTGTRLCGDNGKGATGSYVTCEGDCRPTSYVMNHEDGSRSLIYRGKYVGAFNTNGNRNTDAKTNVAGAANNESGHSARNYLFSSLASNDNSYVPNGLSSKDNSDQDAAKRIASEVTSAGGFKGKGEADWLYQVNSDEYLTVNVDATKLTVKQTGPWAKDINGGYRAPAEMVNIDQFAIYGHGTVRDRGDGTYGYYDKRYHYDMHDELSVKALVRNALTFFSEPPKGNFSNTPFIIHYEGNINLVNPWSH